MKTLTVAAIGAAFFLSACGGKLAERAAELYDKGAGAAAKGFAEALNVECLRDETFRQRLVENINAEQAENDQVPRAIAQDCDGDGLPDF